MSTAPRPRSRWIARHFALLALLAIPALLWAADPTMSDSAVTPSTVAAMPLDQLPEALATEAKACAECHEEEANTFASSKHGRAWAHGQQTPASSCQSCHGDGSKHIDSGEAADIQNPSRLSHEQANASCQSCHKRDKSHALWAGSEHEAADLSCLDCHAEHAAQPARRKGIIRTESDLCLSCHKSEKLSLGRRFRHPLAEDKMSCTSCHDAHGAREEHLVKADSTNDLCFSCHAEKRGPFLWEHSPVREDCMSCHKAHGSNHQGMLVTNVTQLCQSCHLQGRHQSVAGYSTAMWNTNRGCLNCHAQIHGSNHPSGPLFQR